MTTNVKDLYLNMPLDDYKYMHISLADIPGDITKKTNLQEISRNGKVAAGLPQTGLLSLLLLLFLLTSIRVPMVYAY